MELKKGLKSIISEGFEGTQRDLQQEIVKRGIDVNQSSVSRALKSLRAQKIKGKWVIKDSNPHSDQVMTIGDHVTAILRNETLILLKTLPGSAHYVGSYLDRRSESSILGTVAGDDSIMVVPCVVKEIDTTHDRLVELLGVGE
ncbi:hypothetical protein N9D31_01785 [Oligoflexaceae bacterium]|nr:hypothetical protein [Oligoflexaceae bacterium]